MQTFGGVVEVIYKHGKKRESVFKPFFGRVPSPELAVSMCILDITRELSRNGFDLAEVSIEKCAYETVGYDLDGRMIYGSGEFITDELVLEVLGARRVPVIGRYGWN